MQRINLNANAKPGATRWGIIGYGHVAVIHTEAIMALGHRLTGFSTTKKAVRNGDATGLIFNIGNVPGRLFDVSDLTICNNSIDLIKSPDVDAFIIATPTNTHADVAELVAATGRHCLIEKPLATTAAEATHIRDFFAKAQGKVAVGHVLPSFTEFEFLLKKLQDRGMRDVEHLTMKRWVPWTRTDDKKDTLDRGGFAADLGIHDVQLLRCAGNPTGLHVVESEMRYGQYQRLKFDLKFQGAEGAFAVDVGATAQCPGWFHHSYEVRFRDGDTFAFDGSKMLYNDEPMELPSRSPIEVFANELRIADAYFRDERPDADFLSINAAIGALQILEAAKKSAEQKKIVML